MQATHTDWAPWKVIDATSGPCAQLAAADWLYQQITAALRCPPTAEPPVHRWPLVDDPVPGEGEAGQVAG